MERSWVTAERQKLLFTPGPLSTTLRVKEAMLRDLGSRDSEFITMVGDIRRRLLAIGGVSEPEYTTVLMQGSGTFGVESILSSGVPRGAHLMVIVNGTYGRRMVDMADILRIDHSALVYPENQAPVPEEVWEFLNADPSITDVAMVHCETTTGIVNPVAEIGAVVKGLNRRYIVDAMSSFGGLPFNVRDCGIDYLTSSANKCIQGVPGFAFVLARRDLLERSRGFARSLSLDLFGQWQELDATGQFRFTPPTHALLAFHRALLELEEEGGVSKRWQRYEANHQVLVQGMRRLGFHEYLAPGDQGPIITSFLYPDDPQFDFRRFYNLLKAKGFVIYPGKLSQVDCFRIGHIGDIHALDMVELVDAIRITLHEMGVNGGGSNG